MILWSEYRNGCKSELYLDFRICNRQGLGTFPWSSMLPVLHFCDSEELLFLYCSENLGALSIDPQEKGTVGKVEEFSACHIATDMLYSTAERCQSGRMCRSRKAVGCKPSRVRIPPSPPAQEESHSGLVSTTGNRVG